MGHCQIGETQNNFQCRCSPGWTGRWCQLSDPNPCTVINPCHNGGTCVADTLSSGSFYCQCTFGWQGQTCDMRTFISILLLQLSSVIFRKLQPPYFVFQAFQRDGHATIQVHVRTVEHALTLDKHHYFVLVNPAIRGIIASFEEIDATRIHGQLLTQVKITIIIFTISAHTRFATKTRKSWYRLVLRLGYLVISRRFSVYRINLQSGHVSTNIEGRLNLIHDAFNTFSK